MQYWNILWTIYEVLENFGRVLPLGSGSQLWVLNFQNLYLDLRSGFVTK